MQINNDLPAISKSAPIRLAVVGGSRGASFKQALSVLPDLIVLTAVCDLDEAILADWKQNYPEIKAYTEYLQLLDDPDVDAVLIATPYTIHARQSILALRAGKHVLSEVIAAHTLEDSWELVEAVEQTGLNYMMAENYCFMRPNMMIDHMVHQGVFGKITYAEGAYLHDCRRLTHDVNGDLTWRGKLTRETNVVSYPTHSLGPVAKWLGINRGDELDYMTAFTTRNGSMAKYFTENFGEKHAGSHSAYWKSADSAGATIRTKKGVIIYIRLDGVSSRPHNMTHYGLQGTNGAYLAARHHREDPLVWIEGRSPGSSVERPGEEPAEWESLWKYTEDYEHPLWKRWIHEAEMAGHGGGDFFVIDEFARSIHEKRRPAVDVYDAVTWSSVNPLSLLSLAEHGKPVFFPDFMKNVKKIEGKQ